MYPWKNFAKEIVGLLVEKLNYTLTGGYEDIDANLGRSIRYSLDLTNERRHSKVTHHLSRFI